MVRRMSWGRSGEAGSFGGGKFAASLPGAAVGAADRERGRRDRAAEPRQSGEISVAGLAREVLGWNLVVGLEVGLPRTTAYFHGGLARTACAAGTLGDSVGLSTPN